jgi:hypothetical protein
MHANGDVAVSEKRRPAEHTSFRHIGPFPQPTGQYLIERHADFPLPLRAGSELVGRCQAVDERAQPALRDGDDGVSDTQAHCTTSSWSSRGRRPYQGSLPG